MNGKDRIITALSLGVADRVPHWENAYNESSIIGIARHFTDDLPQFDFFQRMDMESKVKLFEAVLLLIEELDVDGISMRIFSETDFIDDERYIDEWGVTYRLDPAGEAVVMGGPINDEGDLKGYKHPEVKESDLLALSYCAQRFSGERAIVLALRCPFRLSWSLLGGMPKLLINFRKNPGLVHELFRITTDYTFEAIEMGLKLGADVVSLDGDLAFNSGTFMSPKQFREFIKPYYCEITEFTHKKGVKVFKHTDGEHYKIMEDFIEAGFDGIHPIQPQCMDLKKVKDEVGDRICLLGNIDCMETLVSGSTEDVEEEVKRAIEVASPGGGYILSSSNTIHPGVNPDNYIAMVKAAHKWGVYS